MVESAEIFRFVHGGHGMIDNRLFFHKPANVVLRGFEMFISSDEWVVKKPWSFFFMRNPVDYGWVGVWKFGEIKCCFASFDRKKGYKNHMGTLAFLDRMRKHRVHVQDLVTPLRNRPEFQVYDELNSNEAEMYQLLGEIESK